MLTAIDWGWENIIKIFGSYTMVNLIEFVWGQYRDSLPTIAAD